MMYLLLAILCSSAISIIMRMSSKWIENSSLMLCINYLICFIVAIMQSITLDSFSLSFNSTIYYGMIHGCLYLISFVMFQYNIQKNGAILSSVFMKLGIIVPLFLSVFLFQEIPSIFQIIGMILTICSIILFNQKKYNQQVLFMIPLMILLLSNGLADAMSKIFYQWGNHNDASMFLVYTFAFALLFCMVLCIYRKEKITLKKLLFGVAIGIPNYYSSYFLLKSLDNIPAIIAYPCFSIGTILLIAMISYFIFKERLNRNQWIAGIFIIIALYLLNL